MATQKQQGDQSDRQEREEMFTIHPEILAGGAMPRKSDGSPDRADFSRAGKDRGDDRSS